MTEQGFAPGSTRTPGLVHALAWSDAELCAQGFPVEEALDEKTLRRTKWAHIVGDPACVDLLKQAGIASAQVCTGVSRARGPGRPPAGQRAARCRPARLDLRRHCPSPVASWLRREVTTCKADKGVARQRLALADRQQGGQACARCVHDRPC